MVAESIFISSLEDKLERKHILIKVNTITVALLKLIRLNYK